MKHFPCVVISPKKCFIIAWVGISPKKCFIIACVGISPKKMFYNCKYQLSSQRFFSDTFDPSDWPSKPVPRNTNSNSNSKFDSSKFETKFNHVIDTTTTNDQSASSGSKSGLSGALKSGLTKNSTFASFNSVGSIRTNSSVESIWSNNNSSSVSYFQFFDEMFFSIRCLFDEMFFR